MVLFCPVQTGPVAVKVEVTGAPIVIGSVKLPVPQDDWVTLSDGE
jgi:hypothetical protein